MAPNSNTITIKQLAQGNASSMPLVLIHDGGGTILSYQALGPLDRDVYGISDPHFDSSKPWEGGLPQMAKAYAKMIMEQVPQKEILLGGWSLGGFLALEIAHLAAQESEFSDLKVTGLVLIDSPYPKKDESLDVRAALNSHLPELIGMRPQIRRKIHSSIKNARAMLANWQPPRWDLQETVAEDLKSLRNPPPTILLRATGALTRKNEPVAIVDVCRHDAHLGWDEYEASFVRVVMDIPGNHYSIFVGSNVSSVTEKLGSACEYLCGEVAA